MFRETTNLRLVLKEGEMGQQAPQKASAAQLSTTTPSRGPPCCTQSAWWTTESSPVYASPRGEDPEGRMTELVNASEMVSREKHPGEGNGKPPLSMCQENCDKDSR